MGRKPPSFFTRNTIFCSNCGHSASRSISIMRSIRPSMPAEVRASNCLGVMLSTPWPVFSRSVRNKARMAASVGRSHAGPRSSGHFRPTNAFVASHSFAQMTCCWSTTCCLSAGA